MTFRWTEAVRHEVLPNGLTVLAQAIPGAPAVAVVTHLRAGFFDEPDRLVGVSHVLEHMLFKGTATRGVGAIARETRGAGGSLNAGTGYDHTAYTTVVPPDGLRLALELQSDALQRSILDAAELQRELVVIIEEAKRKLDTPAAVASETLHQLLFDRHRIRRWRIGTEAELSRLRRDDVAEFYHGHYRPEKTIVALAGALEPDAAVEVVREHFDAWARGTPVQDPSPAEPARREVRTRTLRGDVKGGDLALGWRSVPALHPDAIPLDLAALILSAGRAGWLCQRLRLPGIVVGIGAAHFTPTEVGVFAVSGELDPARLDEALAGIAQCVGRLREIGPDGQDLDRVRTLIQTRFSRRLESVEGRAGALAAAQALGDYRLLDEEYTRLLAVSGPDLRRVASEWLDSAAVAAVGLFPHGDPAALDPDRVRAAFRSPAWETITRPALAGPPIQPPPPRPSRQPASRWAGGVFHLALAGADLLLQRKEGVPLASLALYQRRFEVERAVTAGLGALAVRSAARGAGDLRAPELALAFERLGGVLAPIIGSDRFGVGTSVLAHHVVEAARLLDLVFRYPRLESAEIELERQTLYEAVVQDADDMMRYPIQLAFRARFGPVGYGLPVGGLPESVQGLTSEMVGYWHQRALTVSRRPAVVVVGDIEVEPVAERLAAVFGQHPDRDESRWPLEDLSQSGGAESSRREQERAKRQTAIALLFPGPSRLDRARFAGQVWAAIAGGLGGRLFQALRDQRSLAYVVHASVWQRAGAGGLLLYLATSPEREEEARHAMYQELSRFAERPPEALEHARAIRYLAGQILIGRQTGAALAGEIAEAWLTSGPAGLLELGDPTAGIRRVTPEGVRKLARSAFAPGRAVEGLIRGMPAAGGTAGAPGAAMFRPDG